MRLEEEFTDLPYRRAHAQVEPDQPADESDPEVSELKHRLLTTYAYLIQLARRSSTPITLAHGEVTFEAAVHTLCQNLDVPVVHKLRALESAGPLARAPLARAWLAEKLDGVLKERGLPPLAGEDFEKN